LLGEEVVGLKDLRLANEEMGSFELGSLFQVFFEKLSEVGNKLCP